MRGPFYPRGMSDDSHAEGSPLHRHEEWKAETAELHSLLATAQQRLSISPRPSMPGKVMGSPALHVGSIGSAYEQRSLSPLPMATLGAPPAEGVPDAPAEYGGAPASTLHADVRSVLDVEELCDVVLDADDGAVHGVRALLTCRSEHFRELIMASPTQAKLRVEGVSTAALKAVVTYLCTDELPADIAGKWTVEVEVLSLAQRWKVERLECISRRNIGAVLAVENVVGVLIDATKFQMEELGAFCVDYIVRHKDAVREHGNWQTLTQHPDILLRVSLSL